jgi:signal transduction histidine kinase
VTAIKGRLSAQINFDFAPLLGLSDHDCRYADQNEVEALLYFLKRKPVFTVLPFSDYPPRRLDLEVNFFALQAYALSDINAELNAYVAAASEELRHWLTAVKALQEPLAKKLDGCQKNKNFSFDYQKYPTLVHAKAHEVLQAYPALLAPHSGNFSESLAVDVLATHWAREAQKEVTCFEHYH